MARKLVPAGGNVQQFCVMKSISALLAGVTEWHNQTVLRRGKAMLGSIDNLAARHKDVVLLLARLFLAALFLNEVYLKLVNYQTAAGYFAAIHVPLSALSLPASLMFEALAGVTLVIGYLTRPMAFLVCLYCVATALLAHANFGDLNEQLHFLKNFAIAGGALALFVAGPGALSGDGRR